MSWEALHLAWTLDMRITLGECLAIIASYKKCYTFNDINKLHISREFMGIHGNYIFRGFSKKLQYINKHKCNAPNVRFTISRKTVVGIIKVIWF